MTGSTPLDVIIGLVFIYLLYSLLATTLAEALSDIFRWRMRNLRYYIQLMLTDDVSPFRRIHWFIHPPSNQDFAQHFLDLPSIRNLTKTRRGSNSSGSSYMDSGTFAEGLIDLLAQGRPEASDAERIAAALEEGRSSGTIEAGTAAHLQRMLQKSNNDMAKFRVFVKKWFDDTMERSASNYKQWLQRVLFTLGLVLAIAFNVDSIEIAKKLASDAVLSASFADAAALAIKDSSTTDALNAKLKPYLEEANQSLGLGWGQSPWETFSNEGSLDGKALLLALLGWLLTAFAISLGAPFWFDLLNKLMKVRSALPQSSASSEKKESKQ